MPVADFTGRWRTTAFRLTATVTVLFVAAAIICVGAIYWRYSSLVTRQMATEATQELQALARLESDSQQSVLRERIGLLAQSNRSQLYALRESETGQLLAGNLPRWPAGLATTGTPTVFRFIAQDGRPHLAVGVALNLSGGLHLMVARDAAILQQVSREILWWLLIGVAAMSAIGIAVGLLMSAFVLGRIAQMTATSERIMTGRLSERIPTSGTGDELDDLAVNLNRMLARIEELMAGFREVSDNIAHDLKTPLNRLRNRAERALTASDDDSSQHDDLERILVDADDLIRTFNALLQVARLEAGAVDHTLEKFDLTAMVQEMVEFYEPVAEETGANITFAGGDGISVRGNRQLLGQALTNLIENALKYGIKAKENHDGCTAPPAVISVDIQRVTTNIHLSVRDCGGGIAPEDRSNAIKRFGRLDASRSKPGTG
ncbi:MAG: HAMP domain-containing protein, partial [Hyphomicrobiaceae bacterium]